MDSPNVLFLEYLAQMKHAAEDKGNVQGSRIYAKCIRSLKLYPLPLVSASDCAILDGFGDKICSELDGLLTQHATALSLPPETVLTCSRTVPSIWWEQAKVFRPETKKVTKAKRPGPDTGPDIASRALLNPQSGSSDVLLVCDNREVCGTGRGKSELRKELDKVTNFTVKYMTLNISDFCFCFRDTVTILIERKRIDDLAASIKDKRYHDQKRRLKECADNVPFYIIEYKKYHGTLPLRTVYQAIANLVWIHHFKVVFTNSIGETSSTLTQFGRIIQSNGASSETGISVTELNSISNRRQKVTKKRQLSRMLECIHGMTSVHAAKLSMQFQTLSQLAAHYQSPADPAAAVPNLPAHLNRALVTFFKHQTAF